jgi:hypothetical protein
MLVWKIFWINFRKKKSICSWIAMLSEPAGLQNHRHLVEAVVVAIAVEVAAAVEAVAIVTRAIRPRNTVAAVAVAAVSVGSV